MISADTLIWYRNSRFKLSKEEFWLFDEFDDIDPLASRCVGRHPMDSIHSGHCYALTIVSILAFPDGLPFLCLLIYHSLPLRK